MFFYRILSYFGARYEQKNDRLRRRFHHEERIPLRLSRRGLLALLRSKLFRAAVSIILIAVLLASVDLGELAETFRNVAPGLLALAVLVFLVTNMTSVLKWWMIIQAQGASVSWPYLTSIFYMGLFFNNFLPTNFGGDLVRIYKLSRATGSTVDATSSVVLDRASSTFALLMIALVAALLELRRLGTGLALAILAMFVVFLLLIGLFASERTARRLARFPLLRADPFGVRRHLRDFYLSINQFRDQKKTIALVMVLSVIYQALYVVSVNLLALSLDIHLPVAFYFLFIPIVLAVGMMPLSLNGLGVREGAWVLLFTQAEVPAAEALSMSVLNTLMITAVSMIGGIFYLMDPSLPEPGSSESSLPGPGSSDPSLPQPSSPEPVLAEQPRKEAVGIE
ncbi:MAG: lysylphosphatidylglycerol synthase transmembrane domain-containing protein [Thermoleophilia bacterium]